jgi:2,3-bisphosphoglycerate-dependent phosphoglycerate mutase
MSGMMSDGETPTPAAAAERAAETIIQPETDPFLSLKRGATEVYLIRHADALPGADEVVGGGYDEQALSELGRRQASALAVRMRTLELAAVYSSPIGRAHQTAAAIADAAGLDVRIEPDLREIALGPIGPDLQAQLTPDEVAKLLRDRLREIAVIAVTTGNWSSIPDSEPSAVLRARTLAALQRLADTHPGRRVAAVSHGGAINACLAAILGIERDYFFPAANTSVSVVRMQGERRMLFALNDIAHLREASLLGFDASS